MSHYRILLIEDEPHLSHLIEMNLQLEQYQVVTCNNGLKAFQTIQEQAFDAIISDIMVPGIDGLQLCQNIRIKGIKTPLMFISAKSSSKERIEGLKAGAQDYLPKPFDLEELLLRVKNLIAQKDAASTALFESNIFEFEGGRIFFDAFEIIDHRGVQQKISKKEMMLLKLMISKKGQAISREEIMDVVWGYDIFTSSRTIDNLITNFRKYFEEDSKNPKFFHSVRGIGYKFTTD
jgi:two-component system, OmpR family, alkaline phosphatase synthesis response regulator PhoP